jgi:predicted DNA-binding transcriptional regulator AlpA
MGRHVDVDDLVGTSEVAHLLDISRQRAHQLADSRSSRFPDPVKTLEISGAKLWLLAEVEKWARETGRLDADGQPIRPTTVQNRGGRKASE